MRRWIGPTLLGGLIVVMVGLLAIYGISEWRLNQTYTVSEETLSVPDSPGSAARGEHLVRSVSICVDCHGEDLAGGQVDSIPLLLDIAAPNITSGEQGIGDWTDRQLTLAIRHGVKPSGKPLITMPAQVYNHMGDEDLASVIRYLREVPPQDSDRFTQGNPGVMTRVAIVLGMFNTVPATEIDHEVRRPDPPSAGVTPEYGAYLVSIAGCRDCHGTPLSGGRTPGMGPEAPDLTKTGAAGRWNLDDFTAAMRTGVTPDGGEINPVMPYIYYADMTDDEIAAMYEHLQTLPE